MLVYKIFYIIRDERFEPPLKAAEIQAFYSSVGFNSIKL